MQNFLFFHKIISRFSDLQYSQQKNYSTDTFLMSLADQRYRLPLQPIQTGPYRSISCTASTSSTCATAASLTLARAKSFEEKNVGSLLKQPVSISEHDEDPNNFTVNAQNNTKNQINNEQNIVSNVVSNNNNNNNNQKLSIDSTKTDSECVSDNTALIQKTQSDNNIVIIATDNKNINKTLDTSHDNTYSATTTTNLGLSDLDSSNLGECISSSSVTSTPTPTIHVVTCPTIEIELKEDDDNLDDDDDDDDNDVVVDDDNPTTLDDDNKSEKSSETRNVPYEISEQEITPHHGHEVLSDIVEEESTPLESYSENVEEQQRQTTQHQPPRKSSQQLNVIQKMFLVEEEAGINDDLSPTTDEYQECVPFQAQRGDSEDYDLASGGSSCVGVVSCGHLAPGCVAPAPTPAPSIAPLAEVEFDPQDDEVDVEVREVVEIKEEEHKKRRKRRSHDKADSQEKSSTPEEGIKGNVQKDQYAVCPWEDE